MCIINCLKFVMNVVKRDWTDVQSLLFFIDKKRLSGIIFFVELCSLFTLKGEVNVKKALSLLLSVLMLLSTLSCISTVSFAADADTVKATYSGARSYNGSYGEEIGATQVVADEVYSFAMDEIFYMVIEEEGEYRFYAEESSLDTYLDIYTDNQGSYYFDDENGLNFDGTLYLYQGDVITGKVGIRDGDPEWDMVTMYVDRGYSPEDEYDDSRIGETIYLDDFYAEIVSEDACIIYDIYSEEKEISIPSEIEGYKVVGFGEYVWCSSDVTKITLPYTIETLYPETFAYRDKLRWISVSSKNPNFKSVDGVVFTKDGNEIVIIPNDFRGTVRIPSGNKKLTDYQWKSLKKAEKVSVASDHPVMVKEGGVIYNKEYTKIYYGRPTSKNYEMKSTVKVIGTAAFEECKTLESVKLSSKVTDISYATFAGCTSLKTVTLPKKLVSIGEAAFAGTAIESVKLPSTTEALYSTAFYKCTSLETVELNEGLKWIGSSCFQYAGVKAIDIPDSVEALDWSAFSRCSKLSKVDLGSGISYIDGNVFYKCKSLKQVVIPENIKNIYSGAFTESGLTSVKVPSNVETINGAFVNCDNLKSVYIGKGVEEAISAFEGCDNLETVKFGDGFNGDCMWAFSDCPKLKDVTIPNSVTKLAYKEFANCSSLNEIDIPKSVLKVDKWSVYGTGWLNSQKRGVIYLEHVLYGYKNSKNTETVPQNFKLITKPGTTSIASGAFADQKNLVEVVIPDGMKYIGEYAFYDCKNLKSIEIPESVKKIETYAIGFIYGEVYYEEWDYTEYQSIVDPDFVIYGVPGSAAEKYADKYGITFKKACSHKFSKWIVDEEATLYQAGYKHKVCSKCGKAYDITEIEQLECSKPSLKTISNTTSGVKITWGKVKGADEYNIYRKVKGGSSYRKIGTTTKTTYTDKTAKSGKKYYYYVKAVNEAGSSDASSSKSILYLADPTLKTPSSTKKGIVLKWNKITGAEGYRVYRKTGSGSYKKIATVKGSTKVTYTDKSAKKGKTYTYKIKAYKSDNTSVYSNEKKIKDKY